MGSLLKYYYYYYYYYYDDDDDDDDDDDAIIHSCIWPYTAIHSYTQLYQEPTTLVGSWLYIAAALRKLLSWPHIKRVALF